MEFWLTTTIGALLPGGRLALVCGYHHHANNPPQTFEVPRDPELRSWKKRVIADIPYGKEMVAYDMDTDGKLDVAAGPYWQENRGNGQFESNLLVDRSILSPWSWN